MFSVLDAPASVCRVLRGIPSPDEDRDAISSTVASSKDLVARLRTRRAKVVGTVHAALEALIALRALASTMSIHHEQIRGSKGRSGAASGAGSSDPAGERARSKWLSLDIPLAALSMPFAAETIPTGMLRGILTGPSLEAALVRICEASTGAKRADELEQLLASNSFDALAESLPLRTSRWGSMRLRQAGKPIPCVDSRKLQPWRQWPSACFLAGNLAAMLRQGDLLQASSEQVLGPERAVVCASTVLRATKTRRAASAGSSRSSTVEVWETASSAQDLPETEAVAKRTCSPTMLSLLLRATRACIMVLPDNLWQQADPVLLARTGVTTRSIDMPQALKRSLRGLLTTAFVGRAKHAALHMVPSKLKDPLLKRGVDDNTEINDRTGETRPTTGTGAAGPGVLGRVGAFFRTCFGFGGEQPGQA